MAENVAASLAVRIGADIAPLTKGLDQANSKMAGFGKAIAGPSAAIAKLGAAAAAAAVTGIAVMVSKSMEAIDAQAKLAQQLGTTTSSIATLERAGALSGIGMEKIAAAGRALTVRLAQAAQGAGPAADALKQVGLSAEQLSALPLDQRIATINEAIRQTVPAAQQAAVAARFFGEEAGTAILTLDSGTIATAAEQARVFGTALSDVDAAKVEQANDALGTFGLAADGIGKQLAVQFAPLLKALGDQFFGAAQEAGGFGNVAGKVFGATVKAISFVLSAADVLKRAFEGLAAGLRVMIFGAIERVTAAIAKLIEWADKIPGIDLTGQLESVRAFQANIKSIVTDSTKDIARIASEPLAGVQFEEFVARAQAAGQAAAEAAVSARTAVMGDPQEQLTQQVEQNDAKIAEEQRAAEDIDAILEEAYQNKLRRDQLMIEAEQRKKEILGNAFSGLSSLMNSESRKMFEIGKAAAIAQSVIATYTGMSEALKLGWPLGPIAAAAIGLQGFNQVAQIRAQQFKGGGGGKAASNTQAVSAGTAPVNGQGGQGGPSREVVVSGVTPDSLFSGAQIVEMINKAQRDGAVVMRFA